MVELDIMVDKQGPLELWVLLDCVERDRIFEDRSIEIMGAIKGKTVQTDGNDGGDGSHVQERFGRRSKMRGLIYPGIDPERIMPNSNIGVLQDCGRRRSSCGKIEATAVERSVLWHSSSGQVVE